MQLSKILEKLSEKYPDDEDVDMALSLSLEEEAPEDEDIGLEEELPAEGEIDLEFEGGDMEGEEEGDMAEFDLMMGKKKKPSKEY